ncbi:replication initiator protein A [Lactococcus lactis]|uniref:replication initiator protein A n=1 Tax=Lactococcus lactis TaxID=1358 RepID=UPI001F5B70BC|nr:replication initiator protein A [Lactococcus lactis]WDA67547.1 replication initiator protein A [Lactococcus lactis]
MTTFNFRKADNQYKTLFFQFPKVLYYSQKYKKSLSLSAKAAYMVLLDRVEYSLKTNWVDEDGNIYFIFTNQELAELLDVSIRTAIKLKKELEDANLLLQKRMGFDPKTGKNEPNRLYLAELEVDATDVYLPGNYNKEPTQTLATSGSANSAHPQNFAQTLATSGSANSAHPQNSVEEETQTLATSGHANFAPNLYNTSSDTSLDNIKDTQKLDFSSSNFSEAQLKAQNQDLVKNSKTFLKDGTHELFLSDEAIDLLQMWCNSPQQLRKMVGIILNAKNAVCKENEDLGVFFIFEEEALQEKILNTLRRYFNAIRTKEKNITNYENYLFGSMKNMFAEYWNNQAFKQSLDSNETNKEKLNLDDSVWSNSNYEKETSQDDLARLERVKLEALAKINSKAT